MMLNKCNMMLCIVSSLMFSPSSKRKLLNHNWGASKTEACSVEISHGCVCWRQESVLWQVVLKSAAFPWWVTRAACSVSCAYLLICWLTLMYNFLLFDHRILSKNIPFSRSLNFFLLSLQEVPKKYSSNYLFSCQQQFSCLFLYTW
jgi:hypothetical protein